MRQLTPLLGLLAVLGCSGSGGPNVAGTAVTAADLALAEGASARASLVDDLLLLRHAKDTGALADPELQARLHRAERQLVAQHVTDVLAKDLDDATLRKAFESERAALSKRRIHVAHLVLPVGNDGEVILARLRSGAAFADIAREVSLDRASAERGGELPELLEGQVDAAFFEAAAVLKAGEVSNVVVVGPQRHIITALADADTATPAFEAAKDALRARLHQQRRAELLATLRERYGVKAGDL